MTGAIAASAAFATPCSATAVTLVVEPGSDRFVDFVRVGVPLPVLTCASAVFAAPIPFSFGCGIWRSDREALYK
jgi:di/tricarboxylate transporter